MRQEMPGADQQIYSCVPSDHEPSLQRAAGSAFVLGVAIAAARRREKPAVVMAGTRPCIRRHAATVDRRRSRSGRAPRSVERRLTHVTESCVLCGSSRSTRPGRIAPGFFVRGRNACAACARLFQRIRRTTRPCDNPARTARSKLASQSIESLRDFARESASSSPMRQSGPFSARAWPRRRRDAVLLLCPCYSLGCIAPSRAKWASPRESHCIFPVINNGRTLDCTPFGATGTTVEFRARYSAAVCRRPNWRNERSTHSRVSFSCTPFWARRARRLSKSTRSRS